MKEEEAIKQRFERGAGERNERTRRRLAASEAMTLGWGGMSAVSRARGFSRQVISSGIKERQEEQRTSSGRLRRAGGGRKNTVSKDASVSEDLERLVEPVTRGDPASALRWTCKSVRTLAQARQQRGHRVSSQLVSAWWQEWGSSLQANRTTREGGEHADRDAQVEHRNAQAEASLAAGEPVIAVDAKKKERIGDWKNGGREWHPHGEPEPGRVSDVPIPERGRATPYGISDLARNAGWVTVGIDHDPAAFAGESIRRWWNEVGQFEYPEAKRLLISADGGGSTGSRLRWWTWELPHLAEETGRSIRVCHVPPGTSTWNTSAHRLFSFISQNWRGKPLLTSEVSITLIAATRTTQGLTVQSFLDPTTSPLGRNSSDEDRAPLRILRDDFHGEWNSTMVPRTPSR